MACVAACRLAGPAKRATGRPPVRVPPSMTPSIRIRATARTTAVRGPASPGPGTLAAAAAFARGRCIAVPRPLRAARLGRPATTAGPAPLRTVPLPSAVTPRVPARRREAQEPNALLARAVPSTLGARASTRTMPSMRLARRPVKAPTSARVAGLRVCSRTGRPAARTAHSVLPATASTACVVAWPPVANARPAVARAQVRARRSMTPRTPVCAPAPTTAVREPAWPAP